MILFAENYGFFYKAAFSAKLILFLHHFEKQADILQSNRKTVFGDCLILPRQLQI